MPHLKKAELVERVVYVASPLRAKVYRRNRAQEYLVWRTYS